MSAATAMIYCMIKEHGRAINILSFVIALFGTSLFIASVVDYRPVSAIASGLTAIYYSYSYLCSHLITEWRVINDERLDRLHEELDLD